MANAAKKTQKKGKKEKDEAAEWVSCPLYTLIVDLDSQF